MIDGPVKRGYRRGAARMRAAERRARVTAARVGAVRCARLLNRPPWPLSPKRQGFPPRWSISHSAARRASSAPSGPKPSPASVPDSAERRADVLSASAETRPRDHRGVAALRVWKSHRVPLRRSHSCGQPRRWIRREHGSSPTSSKAGLNGSLHNARALADGGHLRPGLSVQHARDLLLIFTDEFYDRLVSRAGWQVEDYIATITRAISAALLPE